MQNPRCKMNCKITNSFANTLMAQTWNEKWKMESYQASESSNWEGESKVEFSSSGAEQSRSDCTADPCTFPSVSRNLHPERKKQTWNLKSKTNKKRKIGCCKRRLKKICFSLYHELIYGLFSLEVALCVDFHGCHGGKTLKLRHSDSDYCSSQGFHLASFVWFYIN